jgi:hypothetical protein
VARCYLACISSNHPACIRIDQYAEEEQEVQCTIALSLHDALTHTNHRANKANNAHKAYSRALLKHRKVPPT